MPDTPAQTPLRRDRAVIWTCLALVTAMAWAYLVHLDRQMAASMADDLMMADMGMAVDRTWTATDLFFAFAMWAVMMVGMMAGSAAPVLGLYAASRRGRGRHVWWAVFLFGLGYILVWFGFSACAAVAQWLLHRATLLTPAMAAANPRLGGGILVMAGVYQFTPVKNACLTACRSPLGFLMTHWRDGHLGALRMGAGHGWYCLGCCWAVMCVLFVVGVMNLLWVAALTALVLMEKVGPAGAVVARVAGVSLIAAGGVLLVG